MQRSSKRAVIGVVVIVLAAVATLGVTLLGSPRAVDQPPAAAPRTETGPQPVSIVSSTRGDLTLTVTGHEAQGRPMIPDPADLAAAAAAGEDLPVEVAGARPEAMGAESVIGRDGRVWLRNQTTRYPNAPIGRLDFRVRNVSYWCTGTLIDADTVLTAGHCVHEGATGDPAGWSTRVKFTPGVEGNTAPFGSCGATELLTLGAWFRTGSEYQDLGLVQLDCQVGDTVGWFGYRAATGARALAGTPVDVRGYPGDMVWGSLWTMRDRIRRSQGLMVFYQADTYGGQSGSAVYSPQGDCNGVRGPCILAVHAYGVHGARGPHAQNNHGARLSVERVGVISQLAAENG